MDELQLLRETRNDVGTVPPEAMARGRDRLMTLAAAEGPSLHPAGRPLPIRRPWRRALLATAAAAAIAASFVVVDVVGAEGRPGATAEAAVVLNAAAAAASAASDPVLAPHQYLLVDTKAVYTVTSSDGEQQYGWLASQDGQLYVPADLSAEWVWQREPTGPVQFFDEASRQLAEQQQAESTYTGELLHAPAGTFYGGTQKILGNIPLAEALDTAPRDPQALLELIHEQTAGSGPTPEEAAFTTIADSLRTGVIPADLRAALYQAAALIPGVTVVDSEATLDGRTGISLGMQTHYYPSRTEIIIDPDTGQLIGERTMLLGAMDGLPFPAGTAIGWTAVTTSVVDTAP